MVTFCDFDLLSNKKKPGMDPGEQRTGAAGGFRDAQARTSSKRIDDDPGNEDDEYDEFGR